MLLSDLLVGIPIDSSHKYGSTHNITEGRGDEVIEYEGTPSDGCSFKDTHRDVKHIGDAVLVAKHDKRHNGPPYSGNLPGGTLRR